MKHFIITKLFPFYNFSNILFIQLIVIILNLIISLLDSGNIKNIVDIIILEKHWTWYHNILTLKGGHAGIGELTVDLKITLKKWLSKIVH